MEVCAVATATCAHCGRRFTPGRRDADSDLDSLADTPGAEQPPQAAGWLQGATPADAEIGTNSGPLEYADADLCPACAEGVRRERAR